MAFTRENLIPILVELIKEPEILASFYEFYENIPEIRERYEEGGKPLHIDEGEPGYEERCQEVIDYNLGYFIGDDDHPDNTLVDFLNSHLEYLHKMEFPSAVTFDSLKTIMDGFPAKTFDPDALLDDKHKYVLISPYQYDDGVRYGLNSDVEYMCTYGWGMSGALNLMYLRDDGKIVFVREYQYVVYDRDDEYEDYEHNELLLYGEQEYLRDENLLCVVREFAENEGRRSTALFYEIVNGSNRINEWDSKKGISVTFEGFLDFPKIKPQDFDRCMIIWQDSRNNYHIQFAYYCEKDRAFRDGRGGFLEEKDVKYWVPVEQGKAIRQSGSRYKELELD